MNVNNLIKNCVFSNNHAEQHGGAIFLNSKTNDFNITNSIFIVVIICIISKYINLFIK